MFDIENNLFKKTVRFPHTFTEHCNQTMPMEYQHHVVPVKMELFLLPEKFLQMYIVPRTQAIPISRSC